MTEPSGVLIWGFHWRHSERSDSCVTAVKSWSKNTPVQPLPHQAPLGARIAQERAEPGQLVNLGGKELHHIRVQRKEAELRGQRLRQTTLAEEGLHPARALTGSCSSLIRWGWYTR